MNRVTLMGRLGKDPEVRYAQSGTTIATLNLATDERRPDGKGGWEKHTEWHRVVLFGKTADAAKNYLTKGRQVLIEGALRTRQWQDQSGAKRYSTEVVGNNVEFIGDRQQQTGGHPAAAVAAPASSKPSAGFADDPDMFGPGAADDSDIPF